MLTHHTNNRNTFLLLRTTKTFRIKSLACVINLNNEKQRKAVDKFLIKKGDPCLSVRVEWIRSFGPRRGDLGSINKNVIYRNRFYSKATHVYRTASKGSGFDKKRHKGLSSPIGSRPKKKTWVLLFHCLFSSVLFLAASKIVQPMSDQRAYPRRYIGRRNPIGWSHWLRDSDWLKVTGPSPLYHQVNRC